MRSSINKHRFRNFCIGLIGACGLSLYAFSYKVPYKPYTIYGVSVAPEDPGVIIQAFTSPPPEPPKQEERQEQTKTEPLQVNAIIKVVTNLKPLPRRMPTQLKQINPSNIKLPMLPVHTGPTPVEKFPDEAPQFPGGQKALLAFFDQQIRYDPANYEDDGRVMVEFIVDENGDITDIKILKSSMPIPVDREVKRVMKIMPKWIPGKKAGRPIKARFIQPFIFQLN